MKLGAPVGEYSRDPQAYQTFPPPNMQNDTRLERPLTQQQRGLNSFVFIQNTTQNAQGACALAKREAKCRRDVLTIQAKGKVRF